MGGSKQIVGWIVFFAGLGLIAWTLMSSYNIFTAKTVAPEVFKAPQGTALTQGSGIQDTQAQLQQMIGEQLKGILPADSITKLLNLLVWSMLAFLLLSGGSQIAGLGIKLIKS